MCGRVIQSCGPFRLAITEEMDGRDNRVHNYPPVERRGRRVGNLIAQNLGRFPDRPP
jgi:hypothetical protein